jgi:ubiquinone/menaquinone biosynthesis C-methylase UbiE
MRTPVSAEASSTGQTFAATSWLDIRFEVNRAAYEAQARAVGIQPGWRVLDAGCGSGGFLPILAELVGATGRLDALDLAPENIASVERRLGQWGLSERVATQVGSVLALPYPDATFDAVWCANTTQYLRDAELAAALAELRRVVRAGGLVALKESDATLWRVVPAPAGLLLRAYLATVRAGATEAAGMLRAADLPGWLRRAGLTDIRRHTTLLECSAPLAELALQQWRPYFAFVADATDGLDLPAEDAAFWAAVRDPAMAEAFMHDPNFYACEGNTLAVGRVPG